MKSIAPEVYTIYMKYIVEGQKEPGARQYSKSFIIETLTMMEFRKYMYTYMLYKVEVQAQAEPDSELWRNCMN